MSTRGIRKVSVFTGLMLAVCGCGRPKLIGTDAAVYSGGKLHAVSGEDVDWVYAATVTALQQLEIKITEAAKDVSHAKVVGRFTDGKTVTIRLETGAGNVTNFVIRISEFLAGNEKRSRAIYEKIQQNIRTGSYK